MTIKVEFIPNNIYSILTTPQKIYLFIYALSLDDLDQQEAY